MYFKILFRFSWASEEGPPDSDDFGGVPPSSFFTSVSAAAGNTFTTMFTSKIEDSSKSDKDSKDGKRKRKIKKSQEKLLKVYHPFYTQSLIMKKTIW